MTTALFSPRHHDTLNQLRAKLEGVVRADLAALSNEGLLHVTLESSWADELGGMKSDFQDWFNYEAENALRDRLIKCGFLPDPTKDSADDAR